MIRLSARVVPFWGAVNTVGCSQACDARKLLISKEKGRLSTQNSALYYDY